MNTTNTTNIRLDSLLNPDGFLYNPQSWTREIASAIAHQDGLPELTHDHWEIIQALRDHYHRFGAALPAFSHICHKHHLGKYCVDRLFHSEREACVLLACPTLVKRPRPTCRCQCCWPGGHHETTTLFSLT